MKKSRIKAAQILPVGAAILLSGCAGNTFKTPDGTELWKMGALGVQPLAIGYKNENGKNGFMPYSFIDAKDVGFQKVTRIFDEESKNACLEVAGAGEGVPVEVSAKHCVTKETQGEYEVFLVLNRAQLAKELNKKENQEILEELRKHYKQDARIITGIAYAYNHSANKTSDSNFKVSTEAMKQTFAPKFQLISGSDEKVKLADGTVFGYEMSVLCWEKEASQSVIHIVSPDLYGKGDETCPAGTVSNPDDLGKV